MPQDITGMIVLISMIVLYKT